MTAATFSQWMSDIQQRTETALDCALPAADIAPARLHEAMRYAALGGGKRVCPLLVHAAGQLSGVTPQQSALLTSAPTFSRSSVMKDPRSRPRTLAVITARRLPFSRLI